LTRIGTDSRALCHYRRGSGKGVRHLFGRPNPVKLTPAILEELRVHPRTARRALQRMAELGLVKVEFHRGRSPQVTIRAPEPPDVL
jgi:hypothetical protein